MASEEAMKTEKKPIDNSDQSEKPKEEEKKSEQENKPEQKEESKTSHLSNKASAYSQFLSELGGDDA